MSNNKIAVMEQPNIAEQMRTFFLPIIRAEVEACIAKIIASSTEPPKEWVNKNEALALLQVKQTTFYYLCKQGKITLSYLSPRKILYSRQSIDEYIKSRKL